MSTPYSLKTIDNAVAASILHNTDPITNTFRRNFDSAALRKTCASSCIRTSTHFTVE